MLLHVFVSTINELLYIYINKLFSKYKVIHYVAINIFNLTINV